ncbi:MAG: hypothetical protein QGG25_00225, partial [Phycisphaerae bacterium]|nr:hypothetical protein [Phycisphaerae bacterium]
MQDKFATDSIGGDRAGRGCDVELIVWRAATGKKPGLHIKQASAVNFRSSSYHVMTDSGGNRWDIQYYGSVYRGKSYSYSGGMYLQVGGTNFQTSNYAGWTNKEGELE